MIPQQPGRCPISNRIPLCDALPNLRPVQEQEVTQHARQGHSQQDLQDFQDLLHSPSRNPDDTTLHAKLAGKQRKNPCTDDERAQTLDRPPLMTVTRSDYSRMSQSLHAIPKVLTDL